MDSTTQVLQTLYTTFFVWFLSWTLIETTLSYYKISLATKLKVVFVLWVIALTYYVKYNQGSTDETAVSE